MLAVTTYSAIYLVSVLLAAQVCEGEDYNHTSLAYRAYRIFAAPLAVAVFPARHRFAAALRALAAHSHKQRSPVVPGFFAALYVLVVLLQCLSFVRPLRVAGAVIYGMEYGCSAVLWLFFAMDVVSLAVYIVLLLRDPSIPGEDPHYQYDCILYHVDGCEYCQRIKPPRTSHCTICGTCIERKDHHCTWINKCVGRRNYSWFVAFLMLITAICCCTCVFSYLVQRRIYLSLSVVVPLLCANIVFFTLLSMVGIMQCVLHLRNLAQNRTLNEGAKVYYIAKSVAAKKAGVYIMKDLELKDWEREHGYTLIGKLRTFTRRVCGANKQSVVPVIYLPYNEKQQAVTDQGYQYIMLCAEDATKVAQEYSFYDHGFFANVWEVCRAGLECSHSKCHSRGI